jgi:hypothetical protein
MKCTYLMNSTYWNKNAADITNIRSVTLDINLAPWFPRHHISIMWIK